MLKCETYGSTKILKFGVDQRFFSLFVHLAISLTESFTTVQLVWGILIVYTPQLLKRDQFVFVGPGSGRCHFDLCERVMSNVRE
jgi:hypothetical protein